MDATAPAARAAAQSKAETLVYRHSLNTRINHWLTVIAFVILVMSGLQIFNASPNLDASDKSDPHRRVLAIMGGNDAAGRPVGVTQLFGWTTPTTHLLRCRVRRRPPTAAAGISSLHGSWFWAASRISSPGSGARIFNY